MFFSILFTLIVASGLLSFVLAIISLFTFDFIYLKYAAVAFAVAVFFGIVAIIGLIV